MIDAESAYAAIRRPINADAYFFSSKKQMNAALVLSPL